MGALNAFTSLLVRCQGPVDDVTVRELLPDLSFMEPAGLAGLPPARRVPQRDRSRQDVGGCCRLAFVAAGLSAKLV
jgi:hypothetical protein